jgi:hypothetical protein
MFNNNKKKIIINNHTNLKPQKNSRDDRNCL